MVQKIKDKESLDTNTTKLWQMEAAKQLWKRNRIEDIETMSTTV